MYMAVCESPVRIFNKVSRHFEYVPCGKCDTCHNRRNNQWVDRLVQESQSNKYSLFFTLTYNEESVPRLLLSADDGKLYDHSNGLVVDPYEIPNYRDDSALPISKRLYIHRRKNIPYCSVADVQKFVKRLRFNAKNLCLHTHENPKIRYFIVSEYGPSTYRPHYHGILFFNSDLLAKECGSLLSQSWSLGIVDSSFVRDSAASYVAQYINCVASLPKIYLHRELRPFLVCSKNPPIGSSVFSPEEIRRYILQGDYETTLHDWKRGKFKSVPLWRFLKDNIFPKLQRFDDLNHNERVTLYGIVRYSSAESFEEFHEWCEGLQHDTFLTAYVRMLIDSDSFSTVPGSFYALRNFYYKSCRVLHNCAIYGFTLDEYVGYIENYYQRSFFHQMSEFYKFQTEYAKSNFGDARPLIFLYPGFVYRLHSFINDSTIRLYDDMFNQVVSFGFQLTESVIDSSLYLWEPFRSQLNDAWQKYLIDYKKMTTINHHIFRHSMKTKKKNEYLEWIDTNQFYKSKFNFNFFKSYE